MTWRHRTKGQLTQLMQASVVIIGGGVMGVSLAYHLADSGWQDVVLIEKNDLTHGSTWHAAGLCTHFAHNPTVQELRAHSVRLYSERLPQELGESCGFHASGAMRITRCSDRMQEFAHVAGLSSFTGYPLEIVDPERILELFPLVSIDGIIGGIYEPQDGHVDPTLVTQGMAKVAGDRGVTFMRRSTVADIHHDGSYWHLQIQDTAINSAPVRDIRSTHIVNAAGTWGFEVGQMMGIDIPSVPVLHQYMVTDSVQQIRQRRESGDVELPIIRDPEESWYVRQEGEGLILGPYEKDARVWSPDRVPVEFGAELLPPDLDRVEHIMEKAMARIPMLAECGIKSVVNGPITFTPDANPLVGPAHGLANAWLLTGSSMGIMEGGGAGWFLAHWMTHGAPPMDASAIDSRRFGPWIDRSYRIEKATECFGLQFGIHYPYEQRPAARNRRLSPLHESMLAAGAVMGAVNGHERPQWFSEKVGDTDTNAFTRTHRFDAIAREVEAVAERVALADMSAFSKFEIQGPGTQDLLNVLGTNTAPAVGKIAITHALTPAGGCCAEYTVSRFAPEQAYLISAAASETADFDLLKEVATGFDVTLNNVTDQWAVIALMGPLAADLLSSVVDTGALDFPWFQCREINIAGCQVRVLRLSYIGEFGWELHVPAAQAMTVYNALVEAGRKYDLGFFGALAANSMRLEKGYRAWGSDLGTERTPLECGLQQLVKTDGRDFKGREFLLKRANSAERWQMVMLELHSTANTVDAADSEGGTGSADEITDPFYAHPVLYLDKPIGIVTSADYGHRTGKTVALALIRDRDVLGDVLTNNSGDKQDLKLEVEVLGRRYSCKIIERAVYDPDNSRLC